MRNLYFRVRITGFFHTTWRVWATTCFLGSCSLYYNILSSIKHTFSRILLLYMFSRRCIVYNQLTIITLPSLNERSILWLIKSQFLVSKTAFLKFCLHWLVQRNWLFTVSYRSKSLLSSFSLLTTVLDQYLKNDNKIK